MGYAVVYHTGDPTSCSSTSCETGGLLTAGQLQINAVQDGNANDSRHFHVNCLSQEEKQNIQRRHDTPHKLPGYANLKLNDRNRVRESIGWDEDAKSTSGTQNSDSRSDGRTEAKDKVNGKEPEHGSQGNAPGSPRQHAETMPISPEPSPSWFADLATWDEPEPHKAPQETPRVNNRKEREEVNKQEGRNEPEPPKAPQETARANNWREREEVNKQEGRRNAQFETHLKPVTPPVRMSSQANGFRQPRQPSNRDSWDRIRSTPRGAASYALGATRSDPYKPLAPESRLEVRPSAAPSGPPAAPKAEIDSAVVMRLELEDAEAEAGLAEAEVLLAETRVKAQSARRAVIAQKLKMARAGVSV